jgi:outer membrane lipoprotein-sorting protein
MAAVVYLAAGCAVSQKSVAKPPAAASRTLLTATKADLLSQYNSQAQAIKSLNATVTMQLTAGSSYTGVIEKYHEVSGFIVADVPSNIRVIGQAPVVGTTIFSMVSDGKSFEIFIPSKNRFLQGPADLSRQSGKPIENLRPQHLIDALIWQPVRDTEFVLFEQANEPDSSQYVLTVIRRAQNAQSNGSVAQSADWDISRRIWFDRSDLKVSRISVFDPSGKVTSDVHYSDWRPASDAQFARQITLARPGDDYKLAIRITKLSVNETVAENAFVLEPPPGAEIVHLGEEAKEHQP